MSVVRLIVATRSSGPLASGTIIKEIPGSVASGTPYIYMYMTNKTHFNVYDILDSQISHQQLGD